MSHLELDTLKKCTRQLEAVFRPGIKKIAGDLLHMKIITKETYNESVFEVVDVESYVAKTSHLVQEVIARVQVEPKCYYQLINYLRQEYGDIADELDAEYFGTTDQMPATTHSLSCESLRKVLSNIKDKWRVLGEGLKVSDDLLDHFEDLSDPLLEVIIHWMKGGKTTSVSWDTVILVLTRPSVNEGELADKIQRLYCNQKQGSERKTTIADSDITSGLTKVPLKCVPTRSELEGPELVKNIAKIKKNFSQFLNQLMQHLLDLERKGMLEVSVIKSQLVIYDRKLKVPMSHCQTLHDVFKTIVLPEHSSFLNYDLIKFVTDYASDQIKEDFIDYKLQLQKFFENCTIEQSSGGCKSYAVVIDHSLASEVKDLNWLENQVKFLLGHKDLEIILQQTHEEQEKPITVTASTASIRSDSKSSRYSSFEILPSLQDENEAVDEIDRVETKRNASSSFYKSTNQGASLLDQPSVNPEDANQEHQKGDFNDDFILMSESAKQLSASSELHVMAGKGDLPGVIELMKQGHNPMDKDEHGNAVPHYAAICGHLHIVKYFVELGFSPAIPGYMDNTLLHYAVSQSHLPLVRYLLEIDVDALCYSSTGLTPLHCACVVGDIEIVKELIRAMSTYMQGEAINLASADQSKVTPLHIAAAYGHLPVVKYLICDLKSDPSCKDLSCNIPLHLAATEGHLEVVKFLASEQFSYDPMMANTKGNTPLHCAVVQGHLDIVKYFVEERKCDPTIPGDENMTPLHMATVVNQLPVVTYLTSIRDYNAYPNHRKYSPVHIAAKHGHLAILKFFAFEKKCDLQCKDLYDLTPLHCAALEGDILVTEFITSVSDGSHAVTDKKGSTPLHCAAKAGHLDIVKFYIEKMGCDPSSVDRYDETPLRIAASRGHLDIVKYLTLDQGCDSLCRDAFDLNAFLAAASHGRLEVMRFLCSIVRLKSEHLIDNKGRNALFKAAFGGHLPVMKFLIFEQNYDPLCEDSAGLTPLHSAAAAGRTEVIRYYYSELDFLSQALDSIGCSVLNAAAIAGSIDAVKYLIQEAKVNPFSLDEVGQSVLFHASYYGHLPVVKYLTLDVKCDPLLKDMQGYTPFAAAVNQGKTSVVKFFNSILKKTSESVNSGGRNALHLAVIAGNLAFVRDLVEHEGYDPSCLDADHWTPLHHAAANGNTYIIKYLVQEAKCDVLGRPAGAEKNPIMAAVEKSYETIFSCLLKEFGQDELSVQDILDESIPICAGNTPLHVAAQNGHVEAVKTILALIGSRSEILDNNGRNPLHVAAINGHLDVVRHLVEKQGYDSSSTDAVEETPLHHAAANGHLEVVEYLMQEQKCNSMCQNDDDKTPLFIAAEKGHLDIVVALSSNASSEPLTENGRNSLHAAAIGGHLIVVQYLVESCGYDPTCFDHLKNTPSHYAAQHGHVSIIQYLVQDKKSNLASFNKEGKTPLHVAIQNGGVETVKCILTLSNVDERCDRLGCNALHMAVTNGKLDIVQYLVEERGYDVSTIDLAGNTSLHHAVMSGHLPVVNYLITDKNCNLLAKNKKDGTPLQCAIKSGKLNVVEVLCGLKPDDVGPSALLLAITHGHLNIAKYLIDSVGCSLSCVDDSMAPLHNAAAIGNLEIVKYLIDDRKCDPMMRCLSNLFTPLHYASLNGHLNIVKYYVKELTCDPTVRDMTNTTPLHLSASNGHLEIVKYLVSVSSPIVFNDDRHLPISFASCCGHVEVMKFLEPFNDIFAVDVDGWSCLHHAADGGQLNAVRYLIEERLFVPSIQDFSKVTPLHLAAWRGHLAIISYLILDKGCNPLCRDSALDTPLHWAASEGRLEVVQFFAMIGTSLQVQGENSNTPLDYAIFYGHESVAEFLCNSLFE